MANSPLAVGKYKAVFFSCLLLAFGLGTWSLFWFGFDWKTAATDSFFSNTLLAAACYLISTNLEYYRPQRNSYFYIAIWCLLLAAIWLGILQYALPAILATHKKYLEFFSDTWPIRFCLGLLVIGWMAMMSILWYNQKEQLASERRKADTEQLAKEAELYKLRLQLQPHFLFNSLNSINALIGSQPQEARRMVYQLSEFLRSTLKKDEFEWITLAEELQHLTLYLEIEKMRFGHRLNTQIAYSEAVAQLKMPPMLLQPVVENAIKFGLYDTTGNVTISIEAKNTASLLEITVQNPYDVESSVAKRGTGFGLAGVQRRLYLLFARQDLLETKASEHTFTTLIKIPQKP